MVTDRMIVTADLPLLAESLKRDAYHKETKPEFFTAFGTVTKVYEDQDGPILFARASKALRLDLQYVDNNDHKRNMKAMLDGFDRLAEKAKENGFTEVCFESNSPMLKQFCIRRFGFIEGNGSTLRKLLS